MRHRTEINRKFGLNVLDNFRAMSFYKIQTIYYGNVITELRICLVIVNEYYMFVN